ncbi:hypothetical protein O181_022858 [Austropuccinia psidii MF-1]|uniref:Peptidase A2 domain-containing protein n=1 Tax=Austropuccinia psidii MF-1 TaxID=1389203 RepID=A0A9Q3GWS3_9BASI|nr:hypothetical protein [Austropuccinia psidii MF-1]
MIKSVNASNIQGILLYLKLRDYDKPRLHYAGKIEFMEVFIGREKYSTASLVNTGAEINIITKEIAIKASITSRKLNINPRGNGGHKTSFVGIQGFTPITMIAEEQKEIHLFIAKGAIQTILGRTFLVDNNVKLEISHKQGKIFIYPEEDGQRLFLAICNPQATGWKYSPPRGMEFCAPSEIGKWSIDQAESSKRKETEEK